MAKNCGEWGRDKAKERYASGGEVKPLPIVASPTIHPVSPYEDYNVRATQVDKVKPWPRGGKANPGGK